MSGTESRPSRSSLAVTIGFCVFLPAIVFLLWTEHRAHLFGVLPLLILLACPLIHVFMHRGQGLSGGGHSDGSTEGKLGGSHRHGEAS